MCRSLWVAWAFLTTLSLKTHGHKIAFHLFIFSVISFIDSFLFSVRKYLTLISFLNILLCFSVTISETFPISFSNHLLQAFRNTTEFCILILNPTTLLSSLVNNNIHLLLCPGSLLFLFLALITLARLLALCWPSLPYSPPFRKRSPFSPS